MQEFHEYPKWVHVGDGVIVWSREEEDALRKKEAPEEVKPKRGRPKKEVNHGDQ